MLKIESLQHFNIVNIAMFTVSSGSGINGSELKQDNIASPAC
jgi:hypothetical protein